jgi:HEAT repeat protein
LRLEKTNNNTKDVRQAAALALGIMASKQATSSLLAALKEEDTVTTKMAMIRALGAIGDESTLPILLREAWSSEVLVSTQAVFAISHFGEPIEMASSTQISDRLFSKDATASAINAESFTRDIFATPITKRDASALLLKHQSEVEESLEEALNNSSRRGKILSSLDEEDSLLSLGGLLAANGENQIILQGIVSRLAPKLIAVLGEKETADNKAKIVRILGKAKIEAATEPLTQIAQSTKAYFFPMQIQAVIALGRINTATTQKTLQELSKNPDMFMRHAAATGFGASGDISNERFILPLFEDEEALVRNGALWALEQLGSTEISMSGLEKLSKQDPQTRVNVVKVLAKNNTSRATELLKVLAEDQDATVSLKAKDTLALRLKK